jgi:single-strand DNA-binding protein
MLNHIVLHGRLSRDVELKHTQSGVAVATTAIAVERDKAGADDQRQADFIDLVAWRQTGEHLARFFSKGKEILVSGRLETRQWTDKEGNPRVQVEVNAERIDFCGPKGAGNTDSSTPLRSAQNDRYGTQTVPAAADGYAPLEDDGELPF